VLEPQQRRALEILGGQAKLVVISQGGPVFKVPVDMENPGIYQRRLARITRECFWFRSFWWLEHGRCMISTRDMRGQRSYWEYGNSWYCSGSSRECRVSSSSTLDVYKTVNLRDN
jgi:hypothetical protein